MSGIVVSHADHLRDAALHAHADMRMALKMLRRFRFVKAWRKMWQGYDRLDQALNTRSQAA